MQVELVTFRSPGRATECCPEGGSGMSQPFSSLGEAHMLESDLESPRARNPYSSNAGLE